MSNDLKRFHATFFEESREGLEVMEAGLLDLEGGRGSADTINAVFRAAHSIKGGSATFGFTKVAELTHVLETLLDELRAGKRPLTTDAMDALLASVDVLRGLLKAAEQGVPPADDGAAIVAQLNGVLTGRATIAVGGGAKPAAAAPKPKAPDQFVIAFAPKPSMFMSGNDPLRIIRELAELGGMKVDCDLSALPAFGDLDPTQSYLKWTLTLPGSAPEAVIRDAFSWVEDECDLSINGDRGAAPAAPAAAEPTPAAAPAPVAVALAAEAPAAPAAGAIPIAAAGGGAPAGGGANEDASIRVQASKVDMLINLVGELVITQAMLKQVGTGIEGPLAERLLAGLETLERNTRDLQEAVISVRMLPVDAVFKRFPRLVRDLAGRLGKQVTLKTFGESTELDKGLIEKISDPMVHLVRNAIDHGLETTEDRIKAGKDPTGTITLAASHQGGNIIIEVSDDGKGLNRERILAKAREKGIPVADNPTDADVWNLIFAPGFSTADAVTDLSGRGVGMDVVRRNIQSLGGETVLESFTGKGTKVTIKLPLTLAILDGMTVGVGNEVFVLPLGYVIESMKPAGENVRTVNAEGRVLKVRGEYLPMVHLGNHFGMGGADKPEITVIVEGDGQKLALEVDALIGQQQVVVKSLETNYRRIEGISGATILGDGRVALILDVPGLVRGRVNTGSKAA
ncbi:chemotaxis protein CheA [Silanimonas sp.]|jgi:two-component system chemotaxis sensor kinase CheA|uniref:chemotaxis protein CheA n=1 Tax=Silanimonas sp. TaxID=1929290 RepID=UPI0022CB1001|nr:chemotaxis protein CheA [Silanimonas sp.]MCZ8115605.1 chemotaxis protein CheA [Silanimonas sp.]